MKRKVRLVQAAERDLDRPSIFLIEKSPSAAERAAIALSQSIVSLDKLSERGRPGPGRHTRELFVPFGRDGYIVRYRVDRDMVIVARIFHSRERR